ncbi:MAG: tRNA dihydrouridine synthase DusB [Oscillospiraceae bacterium]|nr:tRNA dihydrouridine synthase DusB [Oscillospiraceae bacterium]
MINKLDNNIIKIGDVKIKKTAALAPMAGVTNRAFRELAKQYKASYVITEMVSAKALCFGDKKTERLLNFSNIERPIAIQLFGSEPEFLAKAAYISLKYQPNIIDINMGCPVKKITSNNSGSALLNNPKLVEKIIKEVVKAVDRPVTIKIRAGLDENNINACEIAKIAQESGASAITVHGRTKKQMYSGSVSLDIIKQVKSSVSIPVIGNGDITDLESALNMYQKTGCDLVMIGRGCLGAPWIFKNIDDYFNNKINSNKINLKQKLDIMRYHIELMMKYSPEEIAIKEARKHINWYLKNFKNAAIIRNKVSMIKTLDDLNNILDQYICFNE